jgi:mono/diheme cytochrome c family protein
MRFRSRMSVLFAAILVTSSAFGAVALMAQAPAPAAGAQNAEALKLRNPVRADATVLAAGKQLYDAQCASCHGTAGLGDGKMGVALTPKPSNLVDAEWKYGATDGHLFIVIRDGVRQTAMRAYGARITQPQIWQIVTYVRSLNPKPQPSH